MSLSPNGGEIHLLFCDIESCLKDRSDFLFFFNKTKLINILILNEKERKTTILLFVILQKLN